MGSEGRCQVCGEEARDAVACALCLTPHHPDCFEYTGRCSVYGCGGISTRALPGPEAATGAPLVLDEDTAGISPVSLWLAGLPRYVARQGRDLPRTLRHGLTGGLAACAFWMVLLVYFRGLHRMSLARFGKALMEVGPMLVGCGLLQGFVAPFVAPLQHRYPRETTWGSLLVATLALTLGDMSRGPRTPYLMMVGALSGAFAILYATTFAEWLAGPFTPMGRRLGARGWWARVGLTGVAFFLGAVMLATPQGIPVLGDAFWMTVTFAVIAMVAAAPPMEVGREEYRKKLIALGEAGDAG